VCVWVYVCVCVHVCLCLCLCLVSMCLCLCGVCVRVCVCEREREREGMCATVCVLCGVLCVLGGASLPENSMRGWPLYSYIFNCGAHIAREKSTCSHIVFSRDEIGLLMDVWTAGKSFDLLACSESCTDNILKWLGLYQNLQFFPVSKFFDC